MNNLNFIKKINSKKLPLDIFEFYSNYKMYHKKSNRLILINDTHKNSTPTKKTTKKHDQIH